MFPSGIYQEDRGGVCVAIRHPKAGAEWQENARLIKTAPEMLEVLGEVESHYRGAAAEFLDGDNERAADYNLWRRVTDVIERATGA